MRSDLTGTPIVEMRGVSKSFGSVRANCEITLSIMGGEIHAVVGENGAGKSTLMKILYGHFPPDSGTIRLRGEPVRFRHPREALDAGIGMVHQQLLIFPQLSALENVIAGNEPKRAGLVDLRLAESRVGEISARFGFDLPLRESAAELSFGRRQQIELLRVLYRGSEVLILDEPTSLLAPFEVNRLLELLSSLRRSGHTIILISHRLREVFAVADRVTVLHRGRLIRTASTGSVTREEVADLIVHGADAAKITPPSPAASPEDLSCAPSAQEHLDILVLDELTVEPSGNDIGIESFPLRVARGETVGLGGVVGNGLNTLARAIAGMGRVRSGAVRFDGRDITTLSVRDRMDSGIRWLPSNPLEEALLPERSLVDNFLLGLQRRSTFQRYGLLRRDSAEAYAGEQLENQKVRYQHIAQPVSSLSGGNQQKVALARALSGPPRLAILEQPGRGLDLMAQGELRRRMQELKGQGVTFLVISHDLDELLALCDRIGVVYRGRLAGMARACETSADRLGRWMLGLKNGDRD